MPELQPNRRKTLVINPQLQKRLIVTMSLAPALGLSATMALICFFCHNLYNEATRLDVQLDSLMPLFLSVSGFVLVSGFFMVSNALMISHRIAGPTYRLCKSIEQIRNGDVAFSVHLRQGDHLVEIRDELNLLIDSLNQNPPEGWRTRESKQAEETEARVEAARAESEEMSAVLEKSKADPADNKVDIDDVPPATTQAQQSAEDGESGRENSINSEEGEPVTVDSDAANHATDSKG